jgi:VanZ family protein
VVDIVDATPRPRDHRGATELDLTIMAGDERAGTSRWATVWWGTRTAGAIGWTVVVLVMLWSPPPPPPEIEIPYYDLYVHFVLFFGIGGAWRFAGLATRHTLAGGTLFAVVTELVQGVLPWPRTPDVLDVAADVAGLVVATGVMALLVRARWRLVPPPNAAP